MRWGARHPLDHDVSILIWLGATGPAYFIGGAKVFDVNDEEQFMQTARENVETMERGVAERIVVLAGFPEAKRFRRRIGAGTTP